MPPIGAEHGGTVNQLNHLLTAAVGDRAIVAVRNSVRLSDLSEPQPDFALLRPRADPGKVDYRDVATLVASNDRARPGALPCGALDEVRVDLRDLMDDLRID